MTNIEEALAAFARLEERRGPTAREFMGELGLKSPSQSTYWFRELLLRGLIEEIPPRTTVGTSARGLRLSEVGMARVAGQ